MANNVFDTAQIKRLVAAMKVLQEEVNCIERKAASVVKSAEELNSCLPSDSVSLKKCICCDFLNGFPDPVPNPDCPIHGALHKQKGEL